MLESYIFVHQVNHRMVVQGNVLKSILKNPSISPTNKGREQTDKSDHLGPERVCLSSKNEVAMGDDADGENIDNDDCPPGFLSILIFHPKHVAGLCTCSQSKLQRKHHRLVFRRGHHRSC